jgi:predicted transcriptional regulator
MVSHNFNVEGNAAIFSLKMETVSSKRWYTWLHGGMAEKTVVAFTAVKTSNVPRVLIRIKWLG